LQIGLNNGGTLWMNQKSFLVFQVQFLKSFRTIRILQKRKLSPNL
jgi:hypothetical protein